MKYRLREKVTHHIGHPWQEEGLRVRNQDWRSKAANEAAFELAELRDKPQKVSMRRLTLTLFGCFTALHKPRHNILFVHIGLAATLVLLNILPMYPEIVRLENSLTSRDNLYSLRSHQIHGNLVPEIASLAQIWERCRLLRFP